jgi:hypothetical protein
MMVMKMVRILINLKVVNCDGDAFLHIQLEKHYVQHSSKVFINLQCNSKFL